MHDHNRNFLKDWDGWENEAQIHGTKFSADVVDWS
jgi:hypothetical protein